MVIALINKFIKVDGALKPCGAKLRSSWAMRVIKALPVIVLDSRFCGGKQVNKTRCVIVWNLAGNAYSRSPRVRAKEINSDRGCS